MERRAEKERGKAREIIYEGKYGKSGSVIAITITIKQREHRTYIMRHSILL